MKFMRLERARPATKPTLYLLALVSVYVALLPLAGPLLSPRYADWHPFHTHAGAATGKGHLHVYELPPADDAAQQLGAHEAAAPHGDHQTHPHDVTYAHDDDASPHLLPSDGFGLGLSIVQSACSMRVPSPPARPDAEQFEPAGDFDLPSGSLVSLPERPPRATA